MSRCICVRISVIYLRDVLDIVKVAGAKVTGAASYRTRAASSMMLSAKLSR